MLSININISLSNVSSGLKSDRKCIFRQIN